MIYPEKGVIRQRQGVKLEGLYSKGVICVEIFGGILFQVQVGAQNWTDITGYIAYFCFLPNLQTVSLYTFRLHLQQLERMPLGYYISPSNAMYHAKRRGSRRPYFKYWFFVVGKFEMSGRRKRKGGKKGGPAPGQKRPKTPNLHLHLQKEIHQLLHKDNLRLLLKLWQKHGPK